MKFRVIIPARLGSTRLPNKPLKEIEGKTLIERVVEQAKKSNAKSVYVATDSKEIEDHCKQLEVETLMTNSNHKTGSDRLAESCNILGLNDDELVLNVQGDEPFIDPNDIDNLANLAYLKQANMVTLFSELTEQEILDHNVVKIWLNLDDLVNDFSRDINHLNPEHAKKHLGVYGYTVHFLRSFVSWKQSKNEMERNLEQMRAMDNGENIYAIESCGKFHLGVDTELDLQEARRIAKLTG